MSFRSQLDAYDFPKEVMDNLYHFPLEQVHSLTRGDQPACESGSSISNITINNGTHLETNLTDIKTGITEISDKGDSLDSQEDNGNAEPRSETAVKTLNTTEKDNSEVSESVDTTKSDEDSDRRRGKRNKKSKNKRPRPEDRIAAKESRAKEIEAAKNIILQKNIDW